jgi:hypothetical protein
MNKIRINQLLNDIADELNVPDSVLEKAITSYEGLGEYINNNTDYDVKIFPQGSIRLGTLIRPINDADDYDIDLVCYVNRRVSSPKELKNIVGDVLKNSDRYSKLLDEEGRRCWTLKYADEAHFHMDILPAKCGSNFDDEPITITDKQNGVYSYQSSNPKGYAKWFDKKQKDGDKVHQYSIEKINSSGNKSTLQKGVQLLKRHRDIFYSTKDVSYIDDKPISIIITTVAAELIDGNCSLIDFIERVANLWQSCFLEDENGNLILKNPVDDSENFADKWVEHPKRKAAFIEWMDKLKKDLNKSNYAEFTNNIKEAEHLQMMFGRKIVMEAYKKSSVKNHDLFIDSSKSAVGITTNTTKIPIKKHTFYGNGE